MSKEKTHEVGNLKKCEICYDLADKYFGPDTNETIRMHAIDFAHFVMEASNGPSQPILNDVGRKAIAEGIDLDIEAWKLLDLINAEFQSDPMSVQCFDLRIVQRVKQAVEKNKKRIF